MKMSFAAGHGLPSAGEHIEHGPLASLLTLLIRCLEWIGRNVERTAPRRSAGLPELTYWRIQGWPY